MVQVYVDLILKGKKTIDDVPERIREQVRKALEDQGYDFEQLAYSIHHNSIQLYVNHLSYFPVDIQ